MPRLTSIDCKLGRPWIPENLGVVHSGKEVARGISIDSIEEYEDLLRHVGMIEMIMDLLQFYRMDKARRPARCATDPKKEGRTGRAQRFPSGTMPPLTKKPVMHCPCRTPLNAGVTTSSGSLPNRRRLPAQRVHSSAPSIP